MRTSGQEAGPPDAADDTDGVSRSRRWRAMVVAASVVVTGAAVVVLAVAADLGPWASDEVVRGCDGTEAGASDPDEEVSFDSLDDWDRHADVVARVTVVDEQRGGAAADDPEAEAPRILHLQVERAFAGAVEPGDTVRITSHEPYLRTADGEVVVATGPDCFTLVTGDEAVVALVGDGSDPATSALLTHDSVFLVDHEVIASTRRTGPGVDPYEGEPVTELERDVEASVG